MLLPIAVAKGMGVTDRVRRLSHGSGSQIFETTIKLIPIDVVDSTRDGDVGESANVAVQVDRDATNLGIRAPVGQIPLMRAHSLGEVFVDVGDLTVAVPPTKRNLNDIRV